MISIWGIFFSEKTKIMDCLNSDFWKLLKPPLIQFSKFNNFVWVCCFFCKNLSNFVPLHTIDVSWVMEFLSCLVLRIKVFDQKSTVFKWNCCLFWIDITTGPQKVCIFRFISLYQEYQFRRPFFVIFFPSIFRHFIF